MSPQRHVDSAPAAGTRQAPGQANTARTPATTQKLAAPAVVKTGALSMLALVAVGGTRLIHGSLVSHSTERTTYGLVGIMLAASMIASLLMPGGVSSAMSKFVAYYRGAGDLAAAWVAHRFLSRLAMVSSVVLGVVTAIVTRHFYQLDSSDTISLAVLTTTYSLYTVDKAAMYGHGLVSQYARIEVGTSLLAVAATVVVIVTNDSAYLLPLCLGYGLFVVICRYRLRVRRQEQQVSGPGTFDRRKVLTFCALASVGTLASAGLLQATQLLADHFTKPAQVAYFVAAVALVAPLYFLPRAMALALFPAMASAHGAGDRSFVRRQVDLSTRCLASVMTPVFVIGLVASPFILNLFGGAEYAEGADVLRLMLCACFFGILQVPAVNALASGPAAQARIPIISAVVGCVVALSVVAIVSESTGAVGIGLGYLAGTVVAALIPISAVWRIYGLSWAATLARCTGLMAFLTPVTLLAVVRDRPWLATAVTFGAPAVAVTVLWTDLKRLLPLVLRRRKGYLTAADTTSGSEP